MLNFFDIVVASLGVWRLAHMLKHEAGPWDIFIRIREKVGDGMLGKLMDCVLCSSVWLAIIFFIPGTKILVIVLAISAMAIFLERFYGIMLRPRQDNANIDSASGVPGIGPDIQGQRGYDREDLPIQGTQL